MLSACVVSIGRVALRATEAAVRLLSCCCRGVGFVNYGDPDAAGRAVAAMNGMPVGGDKRLFVSLQTHRGGGGASSSGR